MTLIMSICRMGHATRHFFTHNNCHENLTL